MPLLSIVTISYNQAPYLRQCIDSVVEQKDEWVEFIVVDPGSTDGSREILASYGSAIDTVIKEPDDGPADGLNRGFAAARGRCGYYINSDDFLLPGGVERLLTAWARDPDADMLLGEAWLVDGDGRPRRRMVPTPISLDALRRGHCRIVQQGQSFRLDSYRAAGGFNTANRTCWDYELVCRMARERARFTLVPERIGAFRLHGESLTGGSGGERHLRRYHADLLRIRRDILGQAAGARRSMSLSSRIATHLAHPRALLSHLADRAIPERMMRRWRSDTRDHVS